jgi:hypothetical protein
MMRLVSSQFFSHEFFFFLMIIISFSSRTQYTLPIRPLRGNKTAINLPLHRPLLFLHGFRSPLRPLHAQKLLSLFPHIETCLVTVSAYMYYFLSNCPPASGIVSLLFCSIMLKHYAYHAMSCRMQRATKWNFCQRSRRTLGSSTWA